MRSIRGNTIRAFLILEAARYSLAVPAGTTDLSSSVLDTRLATVEAQPRGMQDHHDDHDVMEEPKSKPWLGYYDFLITEGSYKFWIVFELFTCGLLIYSAFAALYYAKYTANDYDYDDYFFKKRSARSVNQEKAAFLGLPAETYLRIFDAISNLNNKYR